MTENSDLVALTIKRPDESLFKQSKDRLATAQNYKIATPEAAIAAGEELKTVKALAKELEDKRTNITGPINKALREVNALFKPAKDWLSQAELLLKGKLLEYQREQERIAREAQAKAEEEARKAAAQLERKAKVADLVGMKDRAEDLREEAEAQVAPAVQSSAPDIQGISTRDIWKAEVTDKMAFLKFVVEQRADLIVVIQIDQAALNAQARSLKDALSLPGVKAVKETIMAARS